MRQRKTLGNEGFIKGFFLLAVLVGIAYALIMFGAPYYRYNTLRSHTKDILALETPSPDRIPAIRAKILEEAAALKVPLTENNLTMTISLAKVWKVKGRWFETVNLQDFYSQKVDFEMDVEY